ncbi:hypothetical protein SISNIDRAFT_470791 [Sistotremastrum niveocremeum HHB9708]|uniref:Uncharacterized protein n=1 Tax=Sistotremastrum niveocremeum HHB9708 TaxID=1314777 RepID=A0A164NEV5_9AGAM|nr:hypothetical protein SISNIDRAFT_470791 [Sistotremastrum niveocremeum HHB9708]
MILTTMIVRSLLPISGDTSIEFSARDTKFYEILVSDDLQTGHALTWPTNRTSLDYIFPMPYSPANIWLNRSAERKLFLTVSRAGVSTRYSLRSDAGKLFLEDLSRWTVVSFRHFRSLFGIESIKKSKAETVVVPFSTFWRKVRRQKPGNGRIDPKLCPARTRQPGKLPATSHRLDKESVNCFPTHFSPKFFPNLQQALAWRDAWVGFSSSDPPFNGASSSLVNRYQELRVPPSQGCSKGFLVPLNSTGRNLHDDSHSID